MVGRELEPAGGRRDERLREVGLAVEPSPVAGEDHLVEVREPVVGEGEGPQRDAALAGLDALPGRERDHEVRALRVQGLVGRRVQGHRREVALAPVGLDHGLQRRVLVRVAEPGVRLPVEVAGPLDGRRLEDGDLLGGVLEDGHDGDERRPRGGRERHRVLEADPALGLAGGDERLRRRARIRQHLEVHAGIAIPVLRLGDEEPGVVRVRGPVEGEADRPGRAGRRGRRRRMPTETRTGSTPPRPSPTAMRTASPDPSEPDRTRRARGAATLKRVARRPGCRRARSGLEVIDGLHSRETGTPPPGAGDGVIDDVRPASFAGTSRIRFGGSAAEPHSQRISAPRRHM